MENVLKKIPNVAIYLDDIIVTGPTEAEHLKTLELVLQRLLVNGLKLKKEKCSFMNKSVNYLGHMLDADGIHTSVDKVAAIDNFPVPVNKQELGTFCGMVKYYHRFLPNVSRIMAPLYKLEKDSADWEWTNEHENSFVSAKKLLKSNTLLVHYDPSKTLHVTCDASSYGIGAVLEQEIQDGMLKPVCYASRTLSKSEKNYSQTEREGLAVIWAVTKFRKYLCGRKFENWTDHKPLLGLLGEKRAVPRMAAGRLIRWSLILAGYDYKLIYKPGCKIPNADCLSRFPLKVEEFEPPKVGEEVLLLEQFRTASIKSDDIRYWTDRDPTLSYIRNCILQGWDENASITEELKPFFNRRSEFTVLHGCILWGNRVVVPPQGRDNITEQLHDTHSGIVKMKNLARCYVWWPSIDKDLERVVSSCQTCQEHRNCPIEKQQLHPWEFPTKPWSRLHIDYAGPINGHMFLIVVDAYSKWLEVIPTYGCTSKVTVSKLRNIFSIHGLPDIIVSDNGSAFTSEEFGEFVCKNGIRHITGAPYHPSTNGLAENAVKTFKNALKKCIGNTDEILHRFLFNYRITPHVTTGVPPCELLMKRKLKSRFDLLKPDINSHVLKKQELQAKNYKGNTSKVCKEKPNFVEGDHVYFKNYSNYGKPNFPGVVEKCTGPISCKIRGSDGSIVHRHFDQIFKQIKPNSDVNIPSLETHDNMPSTSFENIPSSDFGILPMSRNEVSSNEGNIVNENCKPLDDDNNAHRKVPDITIDNNAPLPRRSGRVRKPVERLDL